MHYQRWLMTLALVVVSVTPLTLARADHGTSIGTSFCKWNFLQGPRTVNYYVSTSVTQPVFVNGYDDGKTRISYGGGTWNGPGFNLSFNLVDYPQDAMNGYGRVSQHTVAQPPSSTAVASTFIYPNSGCNLDQGNPIQQSVTSWDPDKRFYSDCRAAGTAWCADPDRKYRDIHDVAAHEFGHWFHLGHSGDNGHTINLDATMRTGNGIGKWNRRDLTDDDRFAAALEYGYR